MNRSLFKLKVCQIDNLLWYVSAFHVDFYTQAIEIGRQLAYGWGQYTSEMIIWHFYFLQVRSICMSTLR